MSDKTKANISRIGVVKIGSSSGHSLVNKTSPLRRLNYFDGKFLRAADLILEQQALLSQIRISNQAGGAGIVHGYDCTLSGRPSNVRFDEAVGGQADDLNISGGFAIDSGGRVLLLHDAINVSISELIDKSRDPDMVSLSTPAPEAVEPAAMSKFDDCVLHSTNALTSTVENTDLYIITLHHIEAYCGEEDVYGKLCSEACSTSTNRSYIIEGLEVRATPLDLSVLLKNSKVIALSQQHLRSRVASAYYEQERQLITSHISATGLTSSIWCMGAESLNANGVPIAVLGRKGNTTLFLDAWTARRERMEVPPRHYWAGRMMMRPWQVFLAQILQFQCHLSRCFSAKDPGAPCKKITEFDPCADTREIAADAAKGMRYLLDQMGKMAVQLSDSGENIVSLGQLGNGFEPVHDLRHLELNYQKLIDVARVIVPDKLLINCGIVEVPSAGYLPVNASSTVSVNEQVERLMGPGVDLRFCIVRPDFVAHALEEAQHMDRICLLSGIDDPAKKPKVDVLVPCGEIEKLDSQQQGTGYESSLTINRKAFEIGWPHLQAKTVSSGLSINANSLLTNSIREISASAFDLPSLKGAARSEALGSGGYSFYCAAKSGKTSVLQQTGSVLSRAGSVLLGGNTYLSNANAMPQSILRLLGAEADVAAESDMESTGNVDGSENVNITNGPGTNENLERLASGFRINTNLGASSSAREPASMLIPTSALWLDLKTERDPFMLNNGDVTDVRAKLTMVITRVSNGEELTTIEQRNFSGQLIIQKGAPQTADTKFTARLIADGVWKESTLGGIQNKSRTEVVKLDEEVEVRRAGIAGLPPTIQIRIVNPSFFAGLSNVQLVFERSWVSATESRVSALLRYQSRDQGFAGSTMDAADDIEADLKRLKMLKRYLAEEVNRDVVLAQAVFKESNSVLRPGNGFHSASLSALDKIGKATSSTGFSDQAGKLLFPPARELPTQLRILAKKSWVLFHRRRTKICEANVAQEVVVKPRLYRVYHINLSANVDISELVAALPEHAADIIAKFKPTPVSTIEFSPGLATVATSHGDVRADWQAAVRVDADVHVGLIASEGEVINDGEVLADARLQSLSDLLAPISEPADNLALLSINEIPPTLAAGEIDGVIIYFTKAVATVCHTVYRVLTDSADTFLGRLDAFLEIGGAPLSSFIQSFDGQILSSSPRFITDSEQFYGASETEQLIASWTLVGDGSISRVVSVSLPETTEQSNVTRAQSRIISQTLGYDDDQYEYRTGLASIFTTCQKASILIAETECHDVYFYTPFNQTTEQLMATMEKLISGAGIVAEMLNNDSSGDDQGSNTFNKFDTVDFYQDSDKFETTSQQRVIQSWQAQLNGTSSTSINGFFVTVAQAGSNAGITAANLGRAKKQGEKIQQLMGINSAGLIAATNNADVAFPVNCRAFTIVVIPQQFSLAAGPLVTYSSVVMISSEPVGASVTTGTDAASDVTDGSVVADGSVTTGVKPGLTPEVAEGVRFDANNEVVLDARFIATIERMTEADSKVENLEVVSIDNTSDAAAEKRAASLLVVLKERGLAEEDAKVIMREADEQEKIEIVRSGMVLNRSILLK